MITAENKIIVAKATCDPSGQQALYGEFSSPDQVISGGQTEKIYRLPSCEICWGAPHPSLIVLKEADASTGLEAISVRLGAAWLGSAEGEKVRQQALSVTSKLKPILVPVP